MTFQPIHQMMVSHHVLVTAQRTLQLEKLHNTLFQTLESIMISKLPKHQRNKLKSLLDINGTQRKMLMEIGLICQQLFKLEKKLLLLLVLLKLMDHLAHRMMVILHALVTAQRTSQTNSMHQLFQYQLYQCLSSPEKRMMVHTILLMTASHRVLATAQRPWLLEKRPVATSLNTKLTINLIQTSSPPKVTSKEKNQDLATISLKVSVKNLNNEIFFTKTSYLRNIIS